MATKRCAQGAAPPLLAEPRFRSALDESGFRRGEARWGRCSLVVPGETPSSRHTSPFPPRPSTYEWFMSAWVAGPIEVAIDRQRARVEQGLGRRRGGSTTRARVGWWAAAVAPSV